MFAKAHVPLVVPSRTKYGDKPYEERRRMIRMCCGRYEIRMPMRMRLYYKRQPYSHGYHVIHGVGKETYSESPKFV
jgi:hypothetical protein